MTYDGGKNNYMILAKRKFDPHPEWLVDDKNGAPVDVSETKYF